MNNTFFLCNDEFSEYMVMLPGWGFCHEIFNGLKLPFNLILPLHPLVSDITTDLKNFLDNNGIKRTALAGWSLGGLFAWQVSEKLAHRIDHQILISVKKIYSKEEIAGMRADLISDRKGAMERFYRLCLAGSPPDMVLNFKKRQQDLFIKRWDMDLLNKGLDVLEQYSIPNNAVPCCDTILCYGRKDLLIKIDDRLNIDGAPLIEIRKGGHLPLFNAEFPLKLKEVVGTGY